MFERLPSFAHDVELPKNLLVFYRQGSDISGHVANLDHLFPPRSAQWFDYWVRGGSVPL